MTSRVSSAVKLCKGGLVGSHSPGLCEQTKRLTHLCLQSPLDRGLAVYLPQEAFVLVIEVCYPGNHCWFQVKKLCRRVLCPLLALGAPAVTHVPSFILAHEKLACKTECSGNYVKVSVIFSQQKSLIAGHRTSNNENGEFIYFASECQRKNRTRSAFGSTLHWVIGNFIVIT